MEKNHMKSSSLVEVEMITAPMINTHWHGFIELLYVVSGQADLTIGENRYTLQPQDIVVINANRHHSYRGSKDLILGRFMISEMKVRQMLDRNQVLFWCNSANEKHAAFGELRSLLNRIMKDTLYERKCSRLYSESLYYRMLHTLCGNFLLPQGDTRYRDDTARSEDRLQEIFAYIRSNYTQNIRLKDLADTLYLSETYVSRYIKKKCGINFVELVNMVRLEQSMEELIDTNTPIIKIAMDNGFASVAAYNKYFKERYQMNPTDYRKTVQAERASQEETPEDTAENLRILEKVTAFINEQPEEIPDTANREREVRVDCRTAPVPCSTAPFLAIINAGTLSELLDYDLQEQILSSKDRLGFQYVRFWDVFGGGTHVDIHAPADRLNFSQIDRALDFLVRNGLKPYFELGYKPHRLLLNADQALFDDNLPAMTFDSPAQMRDFFHAFAGHLVRRYGAADVQQWYFEVHEQEHLHFTDQSFHFAPLTDEEHEAYFAEFDGIAAAFRKVLPQIRIGGGGFPTQHYGEDGLRHVFDLWSNGHALPDFISTTGFPYQLKKENRDYYEKRTTDPYFLLHDLQMAQNAIRASGLKDLPLHVVEYGITLSNRNVINDSCHKGAFLLRGIFSCMREDNVLLGHWLFSDLYADYADTNRLLFGGTGLLNKNSIPKPSWYAFDFLNNSLEQLVFLDSYALVTTDGNGSYCLLCHNMKNLNYSYFAEQEEQITADDLPQMFEDNKPLVIRLVLEHVPDDGTLRIKRQRINASHGNLLTGWREMNLEPDLSAEELAHLRKATTYHLSMQNADVTGGRTEAQFTLEANEITCIRLSR